MTSYQRRTEKCEAIQWTTENNAEVSAFLQSGPRPLDKTDFTFTDIGGTPVLVFGGMTVYANWWVVRESPGNFTTRPDDEFQAAFEPTLTP